MCVLFRDQNSPDLDNGILKVIGKFDTREKRNAPGVISINVDGLLISGCDFYRIHIQ